MIHRQAPTHALAALLLLVLWGRPTAKAAEFFVKPSGDDAADGTTLGTAWKTISRGVKDLKPGDILTIAPGIYDEQVVVAASGAEQQPILIRAQRPGFSVLKASRRLTGFEPLPGARFVSRVKVDAKIYNVIEADTRRMLTRAPGVHDLDQFRCAYVYDDASKTLYVHPSDGRPASAHCIEATMRPDYGLILAKAQYVHVEGLVLQGHYIADRAGHGFGLSMQGAAHCEIRNCTFINNAGGATFNYNCSYNIVRDCLFVGNNDPLYGELAQLYFSAGSDHCSALNNVVLDAETHGIRFYNNATNCTAIGNIIKNSRIGLYFKATRQNREAVRNVVVGSSYINFGSGENPGPFKEEFNTFEEPSWVSVNNVKELSPTDLLFKQPRNTGTQAFRNPEVAGRETDSPGAPDPKFCDPDHLDYRLQADSPFRGKAPGGKDPGAYPFEANVFFVRPDGNDAGDGLSVAQAWKTLAKACAGAAPGATVYLLPGEYLGPLKPAQSGTREKPIVFRSRGEGVGARVTAPFGAPAACDLADRSFVTVEDIRFAGGANAISVANAEGVRLVRCVAEGSAGPSLVVSGSQDVNVRFSLADQGALVADCRRDISVTSSVLLGGKGPALTLRATPLGGVFLENNDYFSRAGGPLIQAANADYADLAEWRRVSGLDAYSISADPKISDAARRSIAPDSPLVGQGQFGRHIGPFDVGGARTEETIADAALREATPTSASFTWWTPQTSSVFWRPTSGWWVGPTRLSRIVYGATPECRDGAVDSYGDLYHRVTLFGLKPNTTYFYRIELNDSPAKTQTARFATPAAEAWKPSRRTLYVAPSGSDANDGSSPEKAFRTLMKAGEEARAGDTVIIGDGVYHETIAPVASGVEGAPVTFKAEHLNAAVLDGSNFHRPSAVYLPLKEHIVIDGLVMRQYAPKNLGRRAGMDYCQVILWGSRNCVVQNCVQYGSGNYGFAGVAMWTRDILLRNNAIIGFEGAWEGRDNDAFRILGNTWYVPMITNLALESRDFVMKNNLFVGASRQKYGVGMVGVVPACAGVDFNAYAFFADDSRRKLTVAQTAPGLAGWRQLRKQVGDEHSMELKAEDVPFAGAPNASSADPAFGRFWDPYRSGQKAPTLSLFDLPAESPLNTAGEKTAPIGARPPR